jgi:hypothetical protein
MVFGGVWLAGGTNQWEDLMGHHLYHFFGNTRPSNQPGIGPSIWIDLTPWLCEQAPLFLCSLLAVAFAWTRRGTPEAGASRPASPTFVLPLLVAIVAQLSVTLAMSGGLLLYIVVISPRLALLAALGLHAVADWIRRQKQLGPARARLAVSIALVVGVVMVALTAGAWATARAHCERVDHLDYAFVPYLRHAEMARIQKLDVADRVASVLSQLPRQGPVFGWPTARLGDKADPQRPG